MNTPQDEEYEENIFPIIPNEEITFTVLFDPLEILYKNDQKKDEIKTHREGLVIGWLKMTLCIFFLHYSLCNM